MAADSKFYKEAVVHIAFLYQEHKKIEKAIDYLKDVIKNTPDNPDFLLYLGSFYEEEENSKKLKTFLSRDFKLILTIPNSVFDWVLFMINGERKKLP